MTAVVAFAPGAVQDLLVDSFRAVLGIRGDAVDEMRQVFAATGTTRDTVGAVGVLITLVSATAFSRALQAVCERCRHLPRVPFRAVTVWRWLLWLAVWLGALLLQVPLRGGFGLGTVTGLALSVLAAPLLWWWSQQLLLGGRIGWRELLPGAVLAGTGTVALSWAAPVSPAAGRPATSEPVDHRPAPPTTRLHPSGVRTRGPRGGHAEGARPGMTAGHGQDGGET